MLANVFLGVGMSRSCAGWFPGGKGGTQMLAGLAPKSQIVKSLLRTPWPARQARNIQQKVRHVN